MCIRDRRYSYVAVMLSLFVSHKSNHAAALVCYCTISCIFNRNLDAALENT